MLITEFLYQSRQRKVFEKGTFSIHANMGPTIILKEIKPSQKEFHKLQVLCALNQLKYSVSNSQKYVNPDSHKKTHLQSLVFCCQRNDVECLHKLNQITGFTFRNKFTDRPILSAIWKHNRHLTKNLLYQAKGELEHIEFICSSYFKQSHAHIKTSPKNNIIIEIEAIH